MSKVGEADFIVAWGPREFLSRTVAGEQSTTIWR